MKIVYSEQSCHAFLRFFHYSSRVKTKLSLSRMLFLSTDVEPSPFYTRILSIELPGSSSFFEFKDPITCILSYRWNIIHIYFKNSFKIMFTLHLVNRVVEYSSF